MHEGKLLGWIFVLDAGWSKASWWELLCFDSMSYKIVSSSFLIELRWLPSSLRSFAMTSVSINRT